MAIIDSIFNWLMTKRMHQIELFMKHPHEVQHELFRELINFAADTEWGKKYDYPSIRSIEEYKKRVPIQDYNDVKSYVDRLKRGEQNLLWPTEVKWFAKSSGTTSDKSKFIPVTTESLEECHFKGGKDMLAIYCNNYPDTQVFSGKSLMMGGSRQINNFSNKSYYGDLSAILIKNLPFWAEFRRTPSMDIALMEDWDEKLEKMARETMKEDVTNISGVPSWTMILLNKILDISGHSTIQEVWPNLEVFFHGAVSFTPYREQYRQLITTEKMHYLETYNASEGFFGIQDQKDSDELLLMLDYGIFYEFIPAGEWDKENPETIGLDQVEEGKNYAIVISSNGGLWRYKIGDTVKFTSTDPYRIKVSGRTKHFINAFGEEVIIENAEEALKIAMEKTDSLVKDYTAAPIYLENDKRGGHEWIIEFSREPDNMDYFNEVLDNALKNINSDYEAKRYGDIALHKPVIHNAPEGTFYEWMKKRGKLGGQNKVPRLSNDRKYLDDILSMKQGTLSAS